MPSRFPIFQFPNIELVAAVAAGAVARTASGDAGHAANLVSRVALLVWAVEELVDGANWFRRVLGAGGAAYALGLVNQPRMEG